MIDYTVFTYSIMTYYNIHLGWNLYGYFYTIAGLYLLYFVMAYILESLIDYIWSLLMLSPLPTLLAGYIRWKYRHRSYWILFAWLLFLLHQGYVNNQNTQIEWIVKIEAMTARHVDCMMKAKSKKAEELCMEQYIFWWAGAIYEAHKSYLQ